MAEEKGTAAPVKRTAGKTGRRKKPEADHAARAAPQDKDTGSKAQEILEQARTEPKPEWEVAEQVVLLPLERLRPFKNHPFKVNDEDELMQDTIDSIMAGGVINPILVRPAEDGKFEVVSGHRRFRASELAGKADIKAIVREMDDDIAIRKGMSEVQTVSAVIHEMAHALLHNRKAADESAPSWNVVMVSEGGTKRAFSSGFETEEEAEKFAESEGWRYVDENEFEWRLEVEEASPEVKAQALSRSTEEVQAESISYAVCAYYGIATGDNSFGYIASWSKDKTLPELRESLEVISKTADGLINDIDRHYAEILKEREAELIAAEPAMAMERLYAVDDRYLHV